MHRRVRSRVVGAGSSIERSVGAAGCGRGDCRGYLLLLGLAWFLAACSQGPPSLSPLAPEATLLAFGDSLTRGKGAAPAQSYPQVLAELSGRRVVNAGVNGELSAEGARRLPALLDRHAPDLLLLCHGGNDLLRRLNAAETEANLRSMIQAARMRDIPVLLIGVPRPGLWLRSPELYQRLAEEYRLPYEPGVLAEVLTEDGLKSDTVHPNAAGYRRVAEAVWALLRASGAL